MKQELSVEIKQLETEYFAEFCKASKVKNVTEYENRLFGNEAGENEHPGLLQERAELEHSIAKSRTELSFLKQQEISLVKNIESLKHAISEEEQKVKTFASVQNNQNVAAKMQD